MNIIKVINISATEKEKEYAKRHYHKLKEEHRCTRCGEKLPTDYNKTQCEKCLKKTREETRRYDKRKKEKNICLWCSEKKPDDEYVLCKECREKGERKWKEWQAKKLDKMIDDLPDYLRELFWRRGDI